MKWFSNINNLDELKKVYHSLALKYHPDCGNDTASEDIMKAINNEYGIMFDRLKTAQNSAGGEKQTTETAEEFINIFNELLRLNDIVIELCGRWLWISGNTKQYKELLKNAGCKWAPKKQMWSWHHEEDGSASYRGKATMEQIRDKYGSQILSASQHPTTVF